VGARHRSSGSPTTTLRAPIAHKFALFIAHLVIGSMARQTFTAPKDRPFPAGLHRSEARVSGATAVGRVEVVSDAAPFLVISDFDDTLAVTQVTRPERALASALFKDSHTQPVVPGMAGFYRCLRLAEPVAPGFALVSGSPVQYVPRTAMFLAQHGFPFFGLYLRHLRPSTLKGYKQPRIRHLLQALTNRVVMVGDSGEHDPEVYAEIRRESPERVARIYIREVGRAADLTRFEGMVLFKDARQAADDAVAQGLISAACRDREFLAAGPG
jgi:phosphatidate phosphatase APP1